MNSAHIRNNLNKKLNDWADHVDDEHIKDLILNKTIITGGSIVSLLQGEEPHDYDVYFRDAESLKDVAEYYVNKFNEAVKEKESEDEKKEDLSKYFTHKEALPIVQRCVWEKVENEEVEKLENYKKEYWRILEDNEKTDKEVRIRVFIRSVGVAGDEDPYALCDDLSEVNKCLKHSKKNGNKYHVKYMTNNAITLSDNIQIVLRFYGEPEQIHSNYDFIHCCSYYTSWDQNLELPSDALEAIINKELIYCGSKYPICSIIRSRKFLNRGWHINAGQYVKMAIQISELDLKNLHVFEEQLIGVDSAYFGAVIEQIEKDKASLGASFEVDSMYLINIINKVFDEGIHSCMEEETESSEES